VDAEVADLYREFQAEKEDLLDAIRQLGQQLLLKDAIIGAFIPQVRRAGARAWRCGACGARVAGPEGRQHSTAQQPASGCAPPGGDVCCCAWHQT
jgi:hypothetical protein